MGPSGPVAQVTRHAGGTSDTARYLHADRLGSVDAVTDSNGTILEHTKRDPFGNAVANFNQPTLPVSISGNNNQVHIGFTGQEQDDERSRVHL